MEIEPKIENFQPDVQTVEYTAAALAAARGGSRRVESGWSVHSGRSRICAIQASLSQAEARGRDELPTRGGMRGAKERRGSARHTSGRQELAQLADRVQVVRAKSLAPPEIERMHSILQLRVGRCERKLQHPEAPDEDEKLSERKATLRVGRNAQQPAPAPGEATEICSSKVHLIMARNQLHFVGRRLQRLCSAPPQHVTRATRAPASRQSSES